MIRYLVYTCCLTMAITACNSSKTDKLLKHKKWKVYDVAIPSGDPYSNEQITQAKDLKSGYYSNAYYQFLDNGLFIATIAGVPDSGRYELLSNGKIISITGASGSRKAEHLVEVQKLDEKHFDMKVSTGEYHFILRTRNQ